MTRAKHPDVPDVAGATSGNHGANHPASEPATARTRLVTALHAHGLRVTRPRLAVFDVLAEGGHLSTLAIADRVRHHHGRVSTQAVYDVLEQLTAIGLVRRIEPAGRPAHYELRAGDNHHHQICRGCGRVVDVDCAAGVRPCLTPSDHHGFTIDEAEIVYWGHRQDCAQHTEPPPPRRQPT